MTSEVKMPVVAWRDDGLQAANGTVGTEHRVVTAKTKAAMPRSAMEPYTDALVLQSDALAAIEAARVEARTWEARYAELRSLIDRRPAMNAGLIEAYAKWTGQCGLVDFFNALDVASGDAGKEAP